ncbi:alkaline ceramidase ydc1 [Blastocladiella emersonii ATCC 22665]|nr:alkaline ceramidase ydc1 [Blastocladiella emersonii ATCC 22665]
MQPQHDPALAQAAGLHPWVIDSIANWCESDFDVVWFIAEFINTLSNIPMILLGLYGMYNARKYGYEARFLLGYAALAFVGFGSAAFHGFLTYRAQLLDETPMVVGTSLYIYAAFQPWRARPPMWLNAIIFGVPALGIAVYIVNRDVDFFQTLYGSMAATVTAQIAFNSRNYFDRARRVIRAPAPAGTTPGSPHSTITVIPATLGTWLVTRGIASYLTGFAFWIADNLLCYSHLIPLKTALGYPLRFVLEGHGYWHLLSGYGTYLVITSMVATRANALARSPLAARARRIVKGGAKDAAVRFDYAIIPVVVLGEEAREITLEQEVEAYGRGKAEMRDHAEGTARPKPITRRMSSISLADSQAMLHKSLAASSVATSALEETSEVTQRASRRTRDSS